MGRFLFGIIIGVLLVPAGIWAWLKYGHPPVAVVDTAIPFERELTHAPMHARVDREAPTTSPVQANEATFIAGAHIYREQCAFCHGISGDKSRIGGNMYPGVPQLWESHGQGVVGVSDDPPGETYWKVANGIRLTGMPSYSKILSDTEMWQVSVLLANADKPLPPAALTLLKQPLNFAATTPAQTTPPADLGR